MKSSSAESLRTGAQAQAETAERGRMTTGPSDQTTWIWPRSPAADLLSDVTVLGFDFLTYIRKGLN